MYTTYVHNNKLKISWAIKIDIKISQAIKINIVIGMRIMHTYHFERVNSTSLQMFNFNCL